MVSEGIEKMMDLMFTETKLTNNDLEVIVGELANHFGEREVFNAIKKVLWQREEARLDHIMGEVADDKAYASQKDYAESIN